MAAEDERCELMLVLGSGMYGAAQIHRKIRPQLFCGLWEQCIFFPAKLNFHLYSFFGFNFREFSTVEAKEKKKFRPPESVV